MGKTLGEQEMFLGKFTGAVRMAGLAFLGLLSVASWGQSSGQAPQEQCSLAVVSRTVSGDAKVCSSDVVQQMARRGQVFEQNQMGLASVLAIGPDFNQKEAVEWFRKAAQKGYAAAQVNLAVMYMNGWGIATDYGAAQHWLRMAADQHFARAYYNLGIMYFDGKGVRQDYGEALRWFRLGAASGDRGSQTNLGYFYDQGLGCARDETAAVQWYRKAAEAGDALGENNLADLYLKGIGVPQDDALAFSWFQKAAVQGQTGARIKLGYMYAAGRGTKEDPETAYAWISAATSSGDPRGKEMLHSLEKILTPAEVAEARQKAISLQTAIGELSAGMFAQ